MPRKEQHGAAKRSEGRTPEYNAWSAIKQRCYNPKSEQFKYYGARGIVMCDRWLNSFENFLADVGKKPSPNHSIDRKNNDGNYEPSNCRWATAKEQNTNRRERGYCDKGGIKMKIRDGEILSLEPFEKLLGLSAKSIYDRYVVGGWSLTATLTIERARGVKIKSSASSNSIEQDFDDTDDDGFQPCDHCDMPDACADFGCAIKTGVRKDFPIDGVF